MCNLGYGLTAVAPPFHHRSQRVVVQGDYAKMPCTDTWFPYIYHKVMTLYYILIFKSKVPTLILPLDRSIAVIIMKKNHALGY